MIAREDGRLVVRGRLTIATVPALFEAGLQYLTSEDLLVDFSRVEAVDSAAVSMLLGWLRAAQRNRHTQYYGAQCNRYRAYNHGKNAIITLCGSPFHAKNKIKNTSSIHRPGLWYYK